MQLARCSCSWLRSFLLLLLFSGRSLAPERRRRQAWGICDKIPSSLSSRNFRLFEKNALSNLIRSSDFLKSQWPSWIIIIRPMKVSISRSHSLKLKLKLSTRQSVYLKLKEMKLNKIQKSHPVLRDGKESFFFLSINNARFLAVLNHQGSSSYTCVLSLRCD
jgi:hypothetical protein